MLVPSAESQEPDFVGEQPLALPENFNPEVKLCFRTTDRGRIHTVLDSAPFAERLVANGTPQDLALAEEVLDAILSLQERNPLDAHYGNFRWTREDGPVTDLNAVEFGLEFLIPIMIRHAGRLSEALRERLLEAIRIGLDEIRRMDVAIHYTNIAMLDCLNSCLGGELLNDAELAERGYAKFKALSDLTARNGAPFEFNTPTYTKVTLEALKRLTDLVGDTATRHRALAMAARLSLSVAVHMHTPTRRWAGPHSRIYHPELLCRTPADTETLMAWAANGTAPAWVVHALERPGDPMQVDEGAIADWDLGYTAYHAAAFAMGTASREISRQSDVFTVHYVRPGEERPGVVFSRYLLNDQWVSDGINAPGKSGLVNLIEEGKFYGVQSGPRMIGLYAPRTVENFASLAPCSRDRFFSAKAAVIWTGRSSLDEIWIGDQRVESLPADVPDGAVVVVVSGEAMVAVRPLTRTDLGHGAPVRLTTRDDSLLLEIYNYLGPEKTFSETERHSRFYRGQIQCGFYAEVAPRSEYGDGKAFGAVVAQGEWRDDAPPAFTSYRCEGQRPWLVEYARDGKRLGIEINLQEWTLTRRWTHDGELGWPQLEAPMARQNASGKVKVDDAALYCGKAPAWLFASPDHKVWVAGYHGEAAPLRLELPCGTVEVEAMGTGTVVWDHGRVTVTAMDVKGTPTVTGGALAHVV